MVEPITSGQIAGWVAAAAAAILGLYITAMKYIFDLEKKQIFAALAAEKDRGDKADVVLAAHSERLRLDELETVKLRGELELLKQSHGAAQRMLDDLRKEIVPRAEWERAQGDTRRQLDHILKILTTQGPTRGSRPGGRGDSSADSDDRIPAVRDR